MNLGAAVIKSSRPLAARGPNEVRRVPAPRGNEPGTWAARAAGRPGPGSANGVFALGASPRRARMPPDRRTPLPVHAPCEPSGAAALANLSRGQLVRQPSRLSPVGRLWLRAVAIMNSPAGGLTGGTGSGARATLIISWQRSIGSRARCPLAAPRALSALLPVHIN